MTKFKVTTVSMMKMEYLVEADNAEYAKDLVTCNTSTDELHQEWIGENIVCVTELVTQQDYDRFVEDSMNGHVADQCLIKQSE